MSRRKNRGNERIWQEGIGMTHEEFQEAANHWRVKERVEMPKDQLKKVIEAYITENNTCALATGTGDYIIKKFQ